MQTMDMIVIVEIAIKRNALTLAFTVLALVQPGQCFAQESSKSTLNAEQSRALDLEGISNWLRDRFSQNELEALRPGELWLESHFCGCNDVPTKHFPYAVVLLGTPKGDLVARPERHEMAVRFTALAVRYGDRYCDLESETTCYGSFPHPCDFTDFRYGGLLVDFFPTCKAD
ncbi:MAG TPA: hypothetical protein VJT81_16560 [Burkholderiales bacterium]|nr:hypothetical protein [Burkholderiales bacterium]